MIPRTTFEKHKTRFNMAENMPSAWLFEFFKEYIQNIADESVSMQSRFLCNIAETAYAIGMLEGKRRAVRAIEKIILEQNK